MSRPLAVILAGSKSDSAHCDKIAAALEALGVAYERRIGSAHKTPGHVSAMLAEYEAAGGPTVYITVAGRSNALSGFVDGAVDSPVIACPPPSDAFGGADLFSSVRMPGGIAPALVLEPANAALLAAKILGQSEPVIAARVKAFRKANADAIIADDGVADDGVVRPGQAASQAGRIA